MKKLLWLTASIVWIFVIAGNLHAITLREAVEISLKENSEIRAMNSETEAYRLKVEERRGILYPKFYVEEVYSRTDNPTYSFMSKLNQERFTNSDFLINRLNSPSAISDYQTSFRFEQSLYVPQVYPQIRMSELTFQAKSMQRQWKRQEIAHRVVNAYLDVLEARQRLIVAEKALSDARENLRIAFSRYDNGLGLYSDVLRARAFVKSAETEKIRAENSLDISKRMLGIILGLDRSVDVEGELPEFLINDLDVYLRAAMERSDLKAVRLQQRVLLESVRSKKAAFLPEFGITGSYDLHHHRRIFGDEGSSYRIMGIIRWKIFDLSAYKGISSTRREVDAINERLNGMIRDIKFRVTKAYKDVKIRRKALELSKAGLEEAEEAIRIVRKRYENSLSPFVDLLNTEYELERARQKVVSAEISLLRAIAELYYESGLLIDELLIKQEKGSQR